MSLSTMPKNETSLASCEQLPLPLYSHFTLICCKISPFDNLGQFYRLFFFLFFCIPELSPQNASHFSICNSMLLQLTVALIWAFHWCEQVGALDWIGRHVKFVYSPVSLKSCSFLKTKWSMPCLRHKTTCIPLGYGG